MPRKVDPKKILRMKHKVEVEVDLSKDSGNEGLALLIEGLPQKGTARQTLEYVVQGFVDTGFAEMSSDASLAELADLEAKLNKKRVAMGKERIDFTEALASTSAATAGDGNDLDDEVFEYVLEYPGCSRTQVAMYIKKRAGGGFSDADIAESIDEMLGDGRLALGKDEEHLEVGETGCEE